MNHDIPLKVRPKGLYCPPGDFYIDAWEPVNNCLVTHAHGDHAYPGHERYFSTDTSRDLIQHRLGSEISITTYPYRQKFKIGSCWVSFHPAGHILGSAQIRIETETSVCVVSGDYKRARDVTCEPFEAVECNTFVTESTFALPIYKWEAPEMSAQKIYDWWQDNRAQGFNSILYCYAMGKAQRIMALLGALTTEPIYLHGAILPIADIYVHAGAKLMPYLPAMDKAGPFAGDLILAPPLAKGSSWNHRFFPYKTAFASGWMQVRGMRKQRGVDRGFVISDHADWPALINTVNETRATTILTTHGQATALAWYLAEQNISAAPLKGLESTEEEKED